MMDYTIDILLIGAVAVLIIEAIKAPIKSAFQNKGLTENATMKKIFKMIAFAVSLIVCFAGSCIYFYYIKQVDPFKSIDIVWYFLGAVGSSQSIYVSIETYGRDGILEWIKAAIANKNKITDLTTLQKLSTTEIAQKIKDGLSAIYEEVPVTEEEIKQILDHIT